MLHSGQVIVYGRDTAVIVMLTRKVGNCFIGTWAFNATHALIEYSKHQPPKNVPLAECHPCELWEPVVQANGDILYAPKPMERVLREVYGE